MVIKLDTDKMDEKVLDLILEKQKDLKKKKNRVVSLETTVNTLLKDAYILEKVAK